MEQYGQVDKLRGLSTVQHSVSMTFQKIHAILKLTQATSKNFISVTISSRVFLSTTLGDMQTF
jgi:hypothetical protein